MLSFLSTFFTTLPGFAYACCLFLQICKVCLLWWQRPGNLWEECDSLLLKGRDWLWTGIWHHNDHDPHQLPGGAFLSSCRASFSVFHMLHDSALSSRRVMSLSSWSYLAYPTFWCFQKVLLQDLSSVRGQKRPERLSFTSPQEECFQSYF